MNIKPTPFPFPISLAFDTVYYVESPDNEPLNEAMRQIAAVGRPLFENAEMQPFPFKLQCLTREELAADRLSSDLAGKFDPELVAETIGDLRECLHADTGGTLTARCLPKFKGHVRVDDHAVCTFEEFGSTSPEEALENVRAFARAVAEENFHRLSNETYYSYQRAKEEYGRPQRHSSVGMEFIIVPPDPKEIIEEMQKHLKTINDSINEQTNIDEIIDSVETELKRLKNKGKMDTPFKLKVENEKIYVILSESVRHEILFDRRDVAKTLYIFFLRQIERAEKEHTKLIYVSKPGLESYKEELLEIYQRIGGKYSATVKDIKSWWDPSYNDFANALSSIRKYFKREFDTTALKKNHHKCYSIELMGEDSRGKDGYGIALDTTDFDLGRLSYKKF